MNELVVIPKEPEEDITYILPFIIIHMPTRQQDLIGLDRNKVWEQVEELNNSFHIVIAL